MSEKGKWIREKVLYNPCFIVLSELVIFHAMTRAVNILLTQTAYAIGLDKETDFARFEFRYNSIYFALLILIIAAFVGFMWLTDRRSLRVFTHGGFKKGVLCALLGMLLGGGLNVVLTLISRASGAVTISFNGFYWKYLLATVPLVFIQSSSEEFALRGYAARYADNRYDWGVAALVCSVPYIFHHIPNMLSYGVDVLFMLNIFLQGIVCYLLVKVTGSFWACCGFHAAWNYPQMFIFGLPCSGWSTSYALLAGYDAKDNFFYNSGYGIEGTWLSVIAHAALIAVLLVIMVKKGKTNFYPGDREESCA